MSGDRTAEFHGIAEARIRLSGRAPSTARQTQRSPFGASYRAKIADGATPKPVRSSTRGSLVRMMGFAAPSGAPEGTESPKAARALSKRGASARR